MKISVLDHSGITAGQTGADAIRDSLDLARHCDSLGYHRYWVSEHHGSDAVGGTAPEVLIAAIASTTSRMRVGSGGIMLPHYAALKVAEQFRVLEAIAPGRIDLGIGRAPGTDGMTARALNPHPNTSGRDEFPGQLMDLMDWLNARPLREGHPFRSVTAEPRGPGAPEVWMLGSSDYGAQVAAHFGLPYCYAHFFSPGPEADAKAKYALDIYREGFRPSATLAEPYGALAVIAMAADTTEQAAFELGSRVQWSMNFERGLIGPFPSPAEVAARSYTAQERQWMDRRLSLMVHGTGAEAAAGLTELGERLGADELIVVTTAFDPAVRRHSYTLLAKAFGLG